VVKTSYVFKEKEVSQGRKGIIVRFDEKRGWKKTNTRGDSATGKSRDHLFAKKNLAEE